MCTVFIQLKRKAALSGSEKMFYNKTVGSVDKRLCVLLFLADGTAMGYSFWPNSNKWLVLTKM